MNDTIKYQIYSTGEILLSTRMFRYMFLAACLLKHWYYIYIYPNTYKSIQPLLKFQKITSAINSMKTTHFISARIRHYLDIHINHLSDMNIVSSYLNTEEAIFYKREFSNYGIDYQLRLKYPKLNDTHQRQGDLLVLKPCINEHEKGVIFIQYNDSINKFCAIYDIMELAKYYRFVIEPSTWGYQEAPFFLLLGLDTEVIVEAQYEHDFNYITNLTGNLIPIRLGAGDWVDPDIFKNNVNSEKQYDAIMIASWLKLKRHELLFRALSKMTDIIKRVALVGYTSSNRTMNDIVAESKKYNITHLIDFYESIPQEEVAKLLAQSRVNIMLSKREGANKALYESFFSDIPVIVTSSNIGVNRDHINGYTGILSEDHELAHKIAYMLDNIHFFSPRKWALENTGYHNSNKKLNDFIKELAVRSGENWTQDLYAKKNFTNAIYVMDTDRQEADQEINKLVRFLRR